MKHKIFGLFILLNIVGCSSNPNKAEAINTQLQQSAPVSGEQKVGLREGEMVVLDKAQVAEKLRDLQNSVYSLEDRVYGTRKLGSLGLYGELKSCQRKVASKQYGGDGNLTWTEPLDRLTDKEDDLKLGLDEKKDLVAVSQEYLRTRLQRFAGYRQILQKRADDFEERIESCKAQLATKTLNSNESSKVMVEEAPKAMTDKAAINRFMCGFVKPGASLQTFMINAFGQGWLALSDFQLPQNLIGGPLKDSKGETRSNGFLFNGWKMSFDNSPVTVGDIMTQAKDAHLVAWAFDHKSSVEGAPTCLVADDGVWNH